jgi:hypothetical protein
MYYWKQCLSFIAQQQITVVYSLLLPRIRGLATMTLLHCCTPEHAYRAITWERFGQIHYIMNDVSIIITRKLRYAYCSELTHIRAYRPLKF